MVSGEGAQTHVDVGATETRAVRRDPPALRRYSWALLTAGLVAGAVAAVAGASLPPVLPTLVLVALMAVATNRIALFPSEWSATAEATVLIAAVVGLANDAALLGPWIVALACGPLDVVHWRERVFSRMAYNSGNRMLSTIAAALAFAAARGASVDPPALRFGLAALAACVVFAASELVGFVGVERFRSGTPARVAVRDDLFFDSLTVPLGMLGALAGWLAAPVGWGATVLVVVPALAVPELVLVRARRAWPTLASTRVVRRVVCVAVAAGVLSVVAALAPLPDTVTLLCLLTVAVLLALELRVSRRAPVAPLVGVGLVAAWLVAPESPLGAAVAVAVVATAAAWMFEAGVTWWAPVGAAIAAAVSTAVFAVSPTRGGAVAAAIVFELLVSTRRARLVWTVPLVCSAVAFAGVWRALGDAASLAFGAALLAVGVVSSAWGAPPWDSRVLARWGGRCRRGHRAALVAAVVLSLGCGAVAVASAAGRGAWVAVAGGVAAAVTAMVLVGVRQWRFVPRRRRVDATVLVTAGLVAGLAYPPLALEREPWSLAVLAAVLGTAAGIGWSIARLADAAGERASPRVTVR